MHKRFSRVGVSLLCLLFSILPLPARASTLLVKGEGATVYLLAQDGMRHAFPNQTTFESWYGATPQHILTIPADQLAAIPLGANVVMRAGERLVKITTDPKVYAISQQGVLHWISTEYLAAALFGTSWNRLVTDIPDVFFANYHIGSPIVDVNAYNRSAERAQASSPGTLFPVVVSPSDGWLTTDQKRRAMQITAVFEDSSPVFQYATVVNLHDGRGYTAGRAGFTTGTGDAKEVIARYTNLVPGNPLAKYLARVTQLSDAGSGSVSGLDGFPDAWRTASKDARFRAVQDQVVDEIYYIPAMQDAARLGIRTALGRAIFFDTIIQHGGGDDHDSLSGIEQRTSAQLGGTPATGIDEQAWLAAFLAMRRATLLHATDSATRAAWAESVARVDALSQLLKEKNVDLTGPFILHLPYDDFVIA